METPETGQIRVQPHYAEDCRAYYSNLIGLRETPYDMILEFGRIDPRGWDSQGGHPESVPAVMECKVYITKQVMAQLSELLRGKLEDESTAEGED